MANIAASIVVYAKLPNIGWRRGSLITARNRRVRTDAMLYNGVEYPVTNPLYQIRTYEGKVAKYTTIGNDLEAAEAVLRKYVASRQLVAAHETLGIITPGATDEPTATEPTSSRTLEEALADWVQEIIDGGWDSETVRAKRTMGKEFMDSCGVKLLSAVTRQHCLQYINDYCTKLGNSNRTRWNKYGRLKEFLTREKMELLTSKDAPKYAEEDPLGLEADELEKFWKVCPEKKRLMYEVFLYCGLRMGELQTLRWVDIDFQGGFIRIVERPEWAWKPKKYHFRLVPVSDGLLEQLRQRQLTSKYALVFHTRTGNPCDERRNAELLSAITRRQREQQETAHAAVLARRALMQYIESPSVTYTPVITPSSLWCKS